MAVLSRKIAQIWKRATKKSKGVCGWGARSGSQEEILKDYDFNMKAKVKMEILLNQ